MDQPIGMDQPKQMLLSATGEIWNLGMEEKSSILQRVLCTYSVSQSQKETINVQGMWHSHSKNINRYATQSRSLDCNLTPRHERTLAIRQVIFISTKCKPFVLYTDTLIERVPSIHHMGTRSAALCVRTLTTLTNTK